MKSERKRLEARLDKLVRDYVRERDKWICYTCGKPGDEAGHFNRRGRRSTRWDLRNVHCQCFNCNGPLKGNKPIYRAKLIKEYGSEVVTELEQLGYETAHFTIDDLRVKVANMKEKLDELINKQLDRGGVW